MNDTRWCEHNEVTAECLHCRLALAEAKLELATIREERRQSRKVALMHRLRRYRDRFVPEGTAHTCHADCMHEACLICSSLNFIEGYDNGE